MRQAEHPDFRTRIYVAPVNILMEKSCFERGMKLVSEKRAEKVRSFRFPEDRVRSLGAGLLLRKALTDLNLSPELSEMEYGENQKPRLKHFPWLSFNLSHSGMRAMCVIGTSETGCDVEQVHDMRMERVAGRFFTEREREYLASYADRDGQTEAFFRLWTLKESYLKFCGRGMALGLDTFSVDMTGARPVLIPEISGGGIDCRFREYFLQDGYHYSCCGEQDDFEDEIRFVNLKKCCEKEQKVQKIS